MIKKLIGITLGFIIGFMLSENATIVRHSETDDGDSPRSVNQFVFIFGIGNSDNDYSIHINDKSTKKSAEQ